MKIVNVEQGSKEWLAWRRSVITATDCSAILGSSPWVTAKQCLMRKLGLMEEQKSNVYMERGKRLEPEARECFIKETGIKMDPVVVESTEFDFLGASLDGLSECGEYVLEIKCGGSNLHQMAVKGFIPEYYMHQMQHQLLVTGAEKCFYYSYDGKAGVCIPVFPDPEFANKLLPKAREFWKSVAFPEEANLKDESYKDMSEDNLWKSYSDKYKYICDKIKSLEETKEECRKELLNLCSNNNCYGNGIKVMKSVTRGRIAYDEIPEIKGIDVEKYRKEATTSWKILVE